MAGSMLTDEALSTSQESMAASPELTEEGLTENFTTTGALLVPPPPISTVIQPEAASKRIMVIKIAFLINIFSCTYLTTPPSYYGNPNV
jgi:hypothetical protein